MTTAILPGCEPFEAAGGDTGVLVLHGFTGNPTSMRPLAEFLAGDGFTVSLPRLPGHGTSVADMMTTGWPDWTGAALDAFDDLAGRTARVAVVGLSMGGGLSAFVAQRRDVGALVLINPLVKPPAPEMIDGLNQLLEAGLETIDAIGSDVKRDGVTELAYDATPLACARSLFEGVGDVYESLGDIVAPSLLLSSREDHVVTADNGDDLVARVRGPIERIWLENSYHVATIDNDQALVQTLTRDFIRKVVAA
ncbi:MAG: alpha/beta fold hydrolase [Actinomycetales bacterium]|nr:alpha/beta fold hydrolase [Actinomycetales bacterium]